MKIILDGAKPRYETNDGQPLPVGIAGFAVEYQQGEGVVAAVTLDMVKVRAMFNPRVCIQLDGALVAVKQIELADGRQISASDLLVALADRAR